MIGLVFSGCVQREVKCGAGTKIVDGKCVPAEIDNEDPNDNDCLLYTSDAADE